MHLHILGICGTFMGGLAHIAIQLGHRVTGSDTNIYPPMSTHMQNLGIEILPGYAPAHLHPRPDLILVGNVMSRGNPAVEWMLDQHLPFTSGPAWLSDTVLKDRHVLAVAGTHGKTTTSSLLAWIVDQAGIDCGFLIGGIDENMGQSARLGTAPYFVIEADEYDSAFFDKRAKFIHYQPRTLIINNLEFDHADIFSDLEAIQRQFHHLVRLVPAQGQIIFNSDEENIRDVLAMGCWSQQITFGTSAKAHWCLSGNIAPFSLVHEEKAYSLVSHLLGAHNAANTIAAIAAANQIGIGIDTCLTALSNYQPPKRRLQHIASINGVSVYDDFAHHPTAIRVTIEALRGHIGNARIVVILEPRSNTMRLGVHRDTLAGALTGADHIAILRPEDLSWDLYAATQSLGDRCIIFDDVDAIVEHVAAGSQAGDHIVIMSNGGFEGIQQRLTNQLMK